MLGEPLALRASSGRRRATRGCPTGVFGGCAPEGAALKMAFVLLILLPETEAALAEVEGR